MNAESIVLPVPAGALKAVAEALGMLGSATLAVQTVVLGASLFHRSTKGTAGPAANRLLGSPSSSSVLEGRQSDSRARRGLLQQGPLVQIVTPQPQGAGPTSPGFLGLPC